MKKIQRKFKALKFSLPRTGNKNRSNVGVDLPPELLVYILNCVKRMPNTRHEVQEWILKAKITDQNVMYNAFEQCSARYTLRKCALVCVFWANFARHAMFSGAILRVQTFERAEWFRHYSAQGSPRLDRICDLIKHIRVSIQLPDTLRSFLPLLCFPGTRTKLNNLDIFGPFPDGYPPSKQDNPHWSLPSFAVPPPSSTPWFTVGVSAIQFPSYRHFFKFFRYFNNTNIFHLSDLSWEGKPPNHFESYKKPAAQYRNHLAIYVQCCQDDVVVGLQMAMMFPDCPLRAVSSRDQDCAINLMKLVGDFYRGVPRAAQRHESLQYSFLSDMPRRYKWHTFKLQILHFPREYVGIEFILACDMHPGSPHASPGRDHSPTKPRIRGLTVIFSSSPDRREVSTREEYSELLMIDISTMQRIIEWNESLRYVVLVFANRGMMLAAIKRYPSICESTPPHLKYVLACYYPHARNSPENNCFEIDRYTLEPTGRRVKWSPEGAMVGRLPGIY